MCNLKLLHKDVRFDYHQHERNGYSRCSLASKQIPHVGQGCSGNVAVQNVKVAYTDHEGGETDQWFGLCYSCSRRIKESAERYGYTAEVTKLPKPRKPRRRF